jgi:YebC/PmpR family DNA-binding regulatory protein
MSGHSHFSTIKAKKGMEDAKRSQAFSRLAKELTLAAREGADPTANPRLRSVIEKAREANMPSDNIDRAIKKSTGEDAGSLEEMLLEAYGPGNVAILITIITDNRNRTLGEMKQILARNQGKFVEGGAVRWLFERRAVVTVPASQEAELAAIEAGAEDTYSRGGFIDIYTPPPDLEAIKKALQAKGIAIESASLDWVPKDRVEISEKDHEIAQKLFGALDANDDVQDIYSNLKDI